MAEDDDFSFEFMAQLLFTTGAQVLRAHNGREAIEALQFHSDIDLVLMDLRMPELNGLEATREIKKTYPQLPVIAQTAFAMEETETDVLKLTATITLPNQFMPKTYWPRLASLYRINPSLLNPSMRPAKPNTIYNFFQARQKSEPELILAGFTLHDYHRMYYLYRRQ